MDLIIVYPDNKDAVDYIEQLHYSDEPIWYNPLAKAEPNAIYLVAGNAEDYDIFCTTNIESHATRQAVKQVGFDKVYTEEGIAEINAVKKQVIANFKPWYHK